VRVAVLLDITSAARVLYAEGAEHDEQWGGCDPFLPVSEPGDLFDQSAVSKDTKHPGLFIPTGWGETRGFKHILDYVLGDRFILEAADAYALFQ
jgi:hypothetical protein